MSSNTTTTERKTLFLIGPGLIGSTLLSKLVTTRKDLDLYALTRRSEQASQLSSLGVTPVQGSLTDHDLISSWASRADVIIHAASADDDSGSFAVVDGIQRRDAKSKKVVYIQTSGNDELVNSWDGSGEKTISDTWSNEKIEQRIAKDAYHRHVDGPLRERLFNNEAEKKYNAVTAIMMPPLIYGVGSEPFKRISIQTPMVTRYMMSTGAFTLPDGHEAGWNAVSVHDLVDAYLLLLQQLEMAQPGDVGTGTASRHSHYVFPAEKEPFKWKDLFDAVVQQLHQAGHPAANSVHTLTGQEDFEKRIGGKDNAYSTCFGKLVYGGQRNSYTKPEYLTALGFKHKAKGVLDSIANDRELDGVIHHGQ